MHGFRLSRTASLSERTEKVRLIREFCASAVILQEEEEVINLSILLSPRRQGDYWRMNSLDRYRGALRCSRFQYSIGLISLTRTSLIE